MSKTLMTVRALGALVLAVAMPQMLSAAMRPCLLAGPARATSAGCAGDGVSRPPPRRPRRRCPGPRCACGCRPRWCPSDPAPGPPALASVGLRRDADGQHHQVGTSMLSLPSRGTSMPSAVSCDSSPPRARSAGRRPCLAQLGVQLAGHVPVQRRQHLLAAAAAMRHLDAQLPCRFSASLQADEAAAHDDGATRGCSVSTKLAHPQRVLHRAQGEHPLGDPRRAVFGIDRPSRRARG